MVHGVTGEYLGAVDQQRWSGKGNVKKSSLSLEVDKWKASDAAVRTRLDDMEKAILVCDREGDILPFSLDKAKRQERFVIREKWDWRAWQEITGIFDALRGGPMIGPRDIVIERHGSVPKKRH